MPDRAPNAAGWYNNDVTIAWSATDPAPSSGTPTTPVPTTASLEGTNTYTSGQSCDPAGNCATGSLELKIDKTDPVISYSVAPAANGASWHNGDVTITFTCSDATSGVASCSSPVTVSSEGANQAVQGTATDNAGNTASVTAIVNLDKTAPEISYSLSSAANSNGWHNGDVTVSFSCSDALSGVASCPSPVTVGEGANQEVSGTATDVAGNTATTTVVLSVDKTKPTVAYSLTGTLGTNGWYVSDVVVDFACLDALSGISFCSQPATLSGDGANQSASGFATDLAGNTENVTASGINIDKTAPAISYSLSQAPNGNGWNKSDVVVTFTCSDTISGVASCTAPVTVGEGANQTVTGTAVDAAGNVTALDVVLNVDDTLPTIAYTLNPLPNANGWNNTNVTVTFTCLDNLSGIASCTAPVTFSTDNANHQVVGTAVDNAGNSASITATVKLDKTAPTASNLTMSGGINVPPFGLLFLGGTTNINVTAGDGLSGVARVEYYFDTDPGVGSGVAMTYNGTTASANNVNIGNLHGQHVLYVRVIDAAGNASVVSRNFRRL